MTNDRDDEFSRVLADTLERSLDRIDPHALAQLADARQMALRRRHRARVAGGLALAAGIAAIAVLPWLPRQSQQVANDSDSAYLAADPEMLADMEMLQALGVGEMAFVADGV